MDILKQNHKEINYALIALKDAINSMKYSIDDIIGDNDNIYEQMRDYYADIFYINKHISQIQHIVNKMCYNIENEGSYIG